MSLHLPDEVSNLICSYMEGSTNHENIWFFSAN
jgi:hypothetical protein